MAKLFTLILDNSKPLLPGLPLNYSIFQAKQQHLNSAKIFLFISRTCMGWSQTNSQTQAWQAFTDTLLGCLAVSQFYRYVSLNENPKTSRTTVFMIGLELDLNLSFIMMAHCRPNDSLNFTTKLYLPQISIQI